MARYFDHEEWVEAARKRRCLTDTSPPHVLARFAEDIDFVHKLERAVVWCEKRGLSVEFTAASGGMYRHDDRAIDVSYRSYPEAQLYTLLHEAGHHLVWTSSPKLYKEKYENGYQRIKLSERTAQHKMDAVAEEYEAWFRGWKLARRLHLFLDKERYIACRDKNVKSYFRWALDIFEYSDKSLKKDV